MPTPIVFDAAKRELTLQERGLDMERGNEVIEDRHLTVQDTRQDYGEIRNITIGFIDGRMVVMVWTPRGSAIRVISLRKANERERILYSPRFS